MTEQLTAIAKNPQNYLILLVLALLGMEVGSFHQWAGDEDRRAISEELDATTEELDRYRRREHEAGLRADVKGEVMTAVEDVIEKKLNPVVKKLDQIEEDLRRGTRWTLQDEVRLYEAEGGQGPDPREVQAKRLAEELREEFGGGG